MINIDDFKKLDLRVGKIVEAEKLEGSKKLIKLQVDLGEEKRQVIAGIGNVYESSELIGKQIVILANLESRKLMGFESQGMILAVNNNEPTLLTPDKEVTSGSKIS